MNLLPETYAARDEFNDRVYEEGAISTNMKRLMATSIAVCLECTSCIIFQTKLAVEAATTKREVVEAASVASASSGLWMVVQTMKDLGKW